MAASRNLRAIQIVQQLNELVQELNGLLLEDDNDARDEGNVSVLGSDQATTVAVRVKIISGSHKGACGRVTGRCGTQFWWIQLDGSKQMVYKMPHNVSVISN